MNSSITPIKLGIKFSPASLILVYRDKSKLRSRQIPVKNVDILTDVHMYAENFKLDQKYRKYFDKIPVNRLIKLIFMIQDNMKGYTLEESLQRAKKFDQNQMDEEISTAESDANLPGLTKKPAAINKIDDYDDFHDTEDEDDDEDEKNSKSVSTIEEVKNKMKTSESTTPSIHNAKTSDALNILSSHMKAVKSNLYDFEDDDEDDDPSDEDEDSAGNLAKRTIKRKEPDDIVETAPVDDLSDASF